MVCQEDHTVLALSENGQVYFKRITDSDFQVYAPASGLAAVEVTGFNYNEFYILVKPDQIYYFNNGQRTLVKILNSGVSTINNIAAVNDRRNASVGYYNEDWLAIATNNGLYPLFRNQTLPGLKRIAPFVHPNFPNPAAYITNSNFKFLDVKYDYPNVNRCYPGSNFIYINELGSGITGNELPEYGPFPAKVNTTLFDIRFYERSLGIYYDRYCLWGSDDGIYGKTYLTCAVPVKIFDGIINDLEEIDLLFSLSDDRFLLAATNEGLYYSGMSLRSANQHPLSLSNPGFLRFGANERINSMATEIYLSGNDEVQEGNEGYCEKIIWLATESGLKEISAGLDEDYYEQVPLRDLYAFTLPVDVIRPADDQFILCQGQDFEAKVNIPANSQGRLLVNWFRDGIPVPQWAGLETVTIREKGRYHAEITAVCENVKLNATTFTVEETTAPQLNFPYPSEVKLCAFQSYPMQTTLQSAYKYRWYKDDVLIPGENTNEYTAAANGKYRVEVSSCANAYVSSSSVNVTIGGVATPVIQTDRAGYCNGEIPRLSVDNPGSYLTRWYFNGRELPAEAGANSITANAAGGYQVSYEDPGGCPQLSGVFNFVPGPTIDIINVRTLSSPCNETAGLISNVLVTGTGVLTYRWLDQHGAVKASGILTGGVAGLRNIGPGSYRLEIKDESSCPALVSAAIPIRESSGLSISEGTVQITNEDCAYGNGSIKGVRVAGAVSFQWLNEDGAIAGTAEELTGARSGKYHLVATNTSGCSIQSQTYEINGPARTTYTLSAKLTNVSCTSDVGSVELVNQGSENPLAYRWIDESNNQVGSGPKLDAGPGKYALYLTDAGQCEHLYAYFPIQDTRQSLPLPTVSDVTICSSGGAVIQVSNAREGTYFLYSMQGAELGQSQTGSFSLTVNENTSYTIIHKQGSCGSPPATVSVTVEAGGLERIANSFSPNGDGKNDFWEIPGLNNYSNGVVSVYNRQGTRVFSSVGYKHPFNGKYRGADLPAGVYYYIIDLKRACGLLTGSLTILK